MGEFIPARQYCVRVFDGTHGTPTPTSTGKPLVTSKHIVGGRLDLQSTYLISEEAHEEIERRSKVSQWDLLFSMIGTVGEVYLECAQEVSYAIKNVGVFSCKDERKARWLYYFLRSPFAQDHIRRYINGAVQKFLPLGALRDFPVLDYSSEGDGAIRLLTTLDAKIDLNQRINAELEALAKTIYDYWFVQFDFPDAKGRPYKTCGGKMVWNEALKREVPVGWSAGSLDDLGRIVGGSTPSTANPEHFGRGMIPWITPKDLSNNKGKKFIAHGETDVSEAGMRSASLTLYPAGTVLMSSRAPVGYLAIALNPVTTNQGFKSFVPSKGYDTSFVYYAVQHALPTIIQHASGSTFVEISGGVLKSVHAVLPNKPTADAFCKLIEPIVKRQQQAELENRELTQLRDWLLPLLMNGQVRVA